MLDILGTPIRDYIKKNGKPSRIERSEYGFDWFVYARDYRKFRMVGVQDDSVVGAYSNAAELSYRGIGFGTPKEEVRAKFGSPLKYIRLDNVVQLMHEPGRKDYFEWDDCYVIVFYDTLTDDSVTAVLLVPKGLELRALLEHPALSEEMVLSYQRVSIDLVNAVRVRMGLRKLLVDGKLMKLALSRGKDMRDRDYFGHYTPERLSPFEQARRMGIRYRSMGENIAFGNHNAIICHESFMNSVGHRYNILKPGYRKIGSGVAYGGDRYVILVEEFSG